MPESNLIIEQYAQHLERKASSLVVRWTFCCGLIGAILGGFPLFYKTNALVPSHLGVATLLLGALAGAYAGYTWGERRAVEPRLQAQLTLRQWQVEQSLIERVIAPPVQQQVVPVAPPVVQQQPAPVAQPAPAPAPQPIPQPVPVAQPAPMPVAPAPAPVAPAPVAPAPVAPAPVAPAPVSPAPFAPIPVSPAPPAPAPVTPPAAAIAPPPLLAPAAAPPLSSASGQ